MYGRSGFRLLVVIALVVGLAFLGIGAYNAGIAAGVAQRAGADSCPGEGTMVWLTLPAGDRGS